MERLIVTGAAGFIGYHVCQSLLEKGRIVLGIDSLTPYYSKELKRSRIALLQRHSRFSFAQLDLSDSVPTQVFFEFQPQAVVHLAAQPGVRHSLVAPADYIRSNVTGFWNTLEAARIAEVQHFLFASSSSVYGLGNKTPFVETDKADHPTNLYAATKRSNELIAHSYSHLFGVPCTGLRFFSVYGPWGRPDMIPMLFASAILDGRPITVFGDGTMKRDFTYVTDTAEAVSRLVDLPPSPGSSAELEDFPSTSSAPFRLLNVGGNKPIEVRAFLAILERELGAHAIVASKDIPLTEMPETCSSTVALEALLPKMRFTPIESGLVPFCKWMMEEPLARRSAG